MPSPERPSEPREPGPGQQEPELTRYYLAARFARQRLAKRAYFRTQETVLRAKGRCEPSTYRFLLEGISHVAVVGETPPEELDRRLRKILAAGGPTPLPAEILQLLLDRRVQASQQGEWVERHYRPGKEL